MEKRVALVIGNGAYTKDWLPNPTNDAEALSAALQRLDFEVLTYKDLPFAALKEALRDFGRALKQAHTALFFYAGHGLQVKGENYIVPTDATLESEADVYLELIAVQTVLAQMEIGNRTSIVILDACRNNPLARNLARAMGTRSVSIGEGLGRLESGVGTYIAFATAANKVASDGGMKATNSPFTAALLRHIETPDLSIGDLMMRVRKDVIEATQTLPNGPQIPWDNNALIAPFYFRRRAQSVPGSAQPAPNVITDRAERDWERFAIAETEDAAIIEAYIAQYEASERLWAARARQRLEVLKALILERTEQTRVEKERKEEVEKVARWKAEGRISVAMGLAGSAQRELWIKPGSGESFRDADFAPELVIVPAGKFLMGSSDSEIEELRKINYWWKEHAGREGPRHEVIIPAPFAVGKYAITRCQFSAFVAATGHKMDAGAYVWTGSELKNDPSKSWRDPGFAQADDHPVVCVSWDDSQAYMKWLSETTGKPYRLLSESEWEYACRAGTTGPFSFDGVISDNKANYDATYTYDGSPKGEYRKKTVPVDEFQPNTWGLYQMQGNVWEWVADCWNGNYEAKGTALRSSGGPWTTGDCGRRVLRGGSWLYIPQSLRAAYRLNNSPEYRSSTIGFRVARTLNP